MRFWISNAQTDGTQPAIKIYELAFTTRSEMPVFIGFRSARLTIFKRAPNAHRYAARLSNGA
jgi:hypothetical protein